MLVSDESADEPWGVPSGMRPMGNGCLVAQPRALSTHAAASQTQAR